MKQTEKNIDVCSVLLLLLNVNCVMIDDQKNQIKSNRSKNQFQFHIDNQSINIDIKYIIRMNFFLIFTLYIRLSFGYITSLPSSLLTLNKGDKTFVFVTKICFIQ